MDRGRQERSRLLQGPVQPAVCCFLDLTKPWPFSVRDNSVGGGAGITVDNFVAGAMTCLTLHQAIAALNGAEAP